MPVPPCGVTGTAGELERRGGVRRSAGGRANVRVAGITGSALGTPDAPAPPPPRFAPPNVPLPTAGGPAKICPSTPTWLNPPPSASATSAANIAHGTRTAALEAANS
jgi:hypothetical protein